MLEALYIQVHGIVQGVGFRPFLYRLADKYQLNGWVLNAKDGVHIRAEGEPDLLDRFVLDISEQAPEAARVAEIELKEVDLEGFSSFEIRFSEDEGEGETTLVSPDLASCSDCIKELFDPQDRRYRYPFINCTNCGPRFTIIEDLPYDRQNTSMKDFPMCEACQAEYDDARNRRFHAQPNACFDCGPHLSWRRPHPEREEYEEQKGQEDQDIRWGTSREESDALLDLAVQSLKHGEILAVKGLGGFHLVCDANNPEALAKLRHRKKRYGQAFAVMMPDINAARSLCLVNEAEESLLKSPQSPIVLLKKRPEAVFATGLADGLPELGVMLPYTPIQHLLAHDFAGMLVMTSANIHDEPIVTDDCDAYRKLGDVADAFLGHNRAIEQRYDDSVFRVIRLADETYSLQCLRRARGYAPLPLKLPLELLKQADTEQELESFVPSIFATGPEQKNTFCLTRGSDAFVSQHIGDMENIETYDAWLEAKKRYETLFNIEADLLACDMHPEYLTSKWAQEQKLSRQEEEQKRQGRELQQQKQQEQRFNDVHRREFQEGFLSEVQHHHAHVVSVMAENKIAGPVAGFAFDGTGYGVDSRIWGGEVLISNLCDFERFINFSYVPMPGGAAAIRHPLRMAYGVLWAFDLLDHPAAQDMLAQLGPTADMCGTMIEKSLNTPYTSSVGRLFDAASALLGVCTEPKYEGEGAILLEAALGNASKPFESLMLHEARRKESYHIDIIKNSASASSTAQDTSVLLFDAAPVFRALLDDVGHGLPTSIISQRFHDAFVLVVLEASQIIRAVYDINTIVLCGGVYMNRHLLEQSIEVLTAEGFTLALNQDVPPNDASVSFGEAVVACCRALG